MPKDLACCKKQKKGGGEKKILNFNKYNKRDKIGGDSDPVQKGCKIVNHSSQLCLCLPSLLGICGLEQQISATYMNKSFIIIIILFYFFA